MKATSDEEACNLLDNLVIASPCSIPWNAMTGGDRKRLCGGCSRYVHNISDMTRREAEAFLQANGTTHCMIFYRRFDGTIMTDDCPVGLRKIRDACRLAARVAAGFLAMLLALPSAFAQQAPANQRGMHRNRFGLLVNDDWKEPTPPPGFYYTGNPAGGGMVLRPLSERHDPVANPVSPQPRPQPKPQPRPQPRPQLMPPGQASVPVPPGPADKPNSNLDTAAQSYYQKGRAALEAGKKDLAVFFLSKALDAFDQQKVGDKKFRAQIKLLLEVADK